MKKILKISVTFTGLFMTMFTITYVLGITTLSQPLKKASFIWWPQSEESFFAEGWPAYLKEGFKKNGYDLQLVTQLNENPIEQLVSSNIIVVACPINKDFSSLFNYLQKKTKVYLWTLESPIMQQQPIPFIDNNKFEKIFTWRKDLVDNKKTFYTPLETRITNDIKISFDTSHKRVLMMQIASNSYWPETTKNIYNARRTATQWWLKSHPDEYELYGKDWPMLLEQLNDTLKPAFNTAYKGYARNKIKTLSKAWFALAFENTRHRDYITEKIYDVMKAGTVPIYLGAPNIEEFVPKECFINYADFKNDEELYEFITHITPEKYQSYLSCIQDFFNSPKIQPLIPKSIADSLLKQIF